MVKLVESLKLWGNNDFSNTLKKELMELGVNALSIQDAATPGKFVNDSEIGITVLAITESIQYINVKVGVLFSETQWGYCCGEEEPMISNAYCEICVSINKNTLDAEFNVL